MMKPSLLLIFILITQINLGAVLAADKKQTVFRDIKETSTATNTNEKNKSDETLNKLLTVKGVPEQYKLCKDANTDLEKMPDCIWNGNGGNGIAPLDDKTRKLVQDMYASESVPDSKATGRAPASTTTSNLTNKSKQLNEDYMSDPAVIALSKIFEKKLEEALSGSDTEKKDTKKIALVDHAKFIELYRTELGKTIINAFTSYCIETISNPVDMVSKKCKDQSNIEIPCQMFFLSQDNQKKATINDNITTLKNSSLATSTDAAPNAASARWTGCIGSVSNVCYATASDLQQATSAMDADRSKTKACVIMDYVKSARKNLIAADAEIEYFNKEATNNPSISMRVENSRTVATTSKNSADVVSTATSKDIEDAYKVSNEKIKKDMEKCIDATGKIIDQESCKKYLNTNTEDKEKALAEFGLKQFALENKMETLAKKETNKSEVEKYLKEEGYKKETIDAMIKNDDNDLSKVKAEILERYKSEREAIISSMADKIKSKTASTDGKIDTATGSSDQQKLKKISDELSTRTDDLKQLVHFNNVVSSYLEIDNGKEKVRNTASLLAEVDNDAASSKDENKKLKEKSAGLAPKKTTNDQNEGTKLGVDTLNKIFKYSTEESTEK